MKRLLLDTHALLWWWTDDVQLSPLARAAIFETKNEVFVSAASAWEIATKQRLGKLGQFPKVLERFTKLLAADRFIPLPIQHQHALKAGSYSSQHRDPFDRMLAAQSALEALTLVTCDAAFAQFDCRTLW